MIWIVENGQLINLTQAEYLRRVDPTTDQPKFVLRINFASGRAIDLTYETGAEALAARDRILTAVGLAPNS